jgi:hypothetical protein
MIHAVMHAWALWAILGVLGAWWRVDVGLHPFAPCRRCKGSGWNRGSRQGAYGLCVHGPRRVRWTGRRAAARQMRRQ